MNFKFFSQIFVTILATTFGLASAQAIEVVGAKVEGGSLVLKVKGDCNNSEYSLHYDQSGRTIQGPHNYSLVSKGTKMACLGDESLREVRVKLPPQGKDQTVVIKNGSQTLEYNLEFTQQVSIQNQDEFNSSSGYVEKDMYNQKGEHVGTTRSLGGVD